MVQLSENEYERLKSIEKRLFSLPASVQCMPVDDRKWDDSVDDPGPTRRWTHSLSRRMQAVLIAMGRCSHSRARIKILEIRKIDDPLAISLEDAIAEGFKTVEEFQVGWRRIHGKYATWPAYALTFKLVSVATSLLERTSNEFRARINTGNHFAG